MRTPTQLLTLLLTTGVLLAVCSLPPAQAADPMAGHATDMTHPATEQDIDPSFMHYMTCDPAGAAIYAPYKDATRAYKLLDLIEDSSAREAERNSPRPTILARSMAIPLTAEYDAWAAYDAKAVGSRLGGELRRPEAEHTQANKEIAISYACLDGLLFVYAEDAEYIKTEFAKLGLDPEDHTMDLSSPVGVGHTAAAAVIEYHRHDGSNQFADEPGTPPGAKPYADYTGYKPVNTVDKIIDPDHWQPITFTKPTGEKFTPGFLTPQWRMVKAFGLTKEDLERMRPPGPPKAGSEEMKREIAENIRYNANRTPQLIATVEFMRDGPRSTGQSGHWLRFAQDESRRNHYGLDDDVKLFFCVGNICEDAFIANWEAKWYYDSSRPWTLIHDGSSIYAYDGQTIRGWKGPQQGTGDIPKEMWHPYSPESFITPPFPGYPSGHSTVSGAASTIIKLYSGSDLYGFVAARVPGALTGEPQGGCVYLELPTWTSVAELAGISRVMGGYHIQCDNVDALAHGRKVANFEWPIFQSYFDGTARIRP
jgi:hypothetical protein